MDIALRATVIFVALYLLVRLMGKRELGQMTPFELIVLVVIGDLIQQGVTQNDFSLTGAIIAISTIAFLALVDELGELPVAVGRASARGGAARHRARRGDPHGNLRRNRLTRSEIESEMRLAGIGHLRGRGVGDPRAARQDQLHPAHRRRGRASEPPPNPPERRGRRRGLIASVTR